MEQITREEMIGLLLDLQELAAHQKRLDLVKDIASALIALQAAEPIGEIDEDDDGYFVELYPYRSFKLGQKLFTLPCPPAKARVPNMATIDDAPAYIWDEAERAAYAVGYNACRRAMLTASPAPTSTTNGCACQGCGIIYTADLIVPDDWWEKIKPEGKAEGAGLLCPTCIMERLVEQGWSAGHVIASPAPDHSGDGPADQFYLQDSRGFVGNDMLFWAKEGRGYVTDLRMAEVFTREDAFALHRSRASDVPWPKAYIDSRARPAVDVQHVDREVAFSAHRQQEEAER